MRSHPINKFVTNCSPGPQVGGVLPWNVQAINTHPDVLQWSPEHSTVITVLTPGLWNLTFGFFARRRPVVQVCALPVVACIIQFGSCCELAQSLNSVPTHMWAG